MLKEEEGIITLDLRSLELNGITHDHLKMALSPSSHLSRPLENPFRAMVTHLLLDYNEIEELPNEIGNIECLKELSIMGNQLNFLPEGIGKLSKLEELNVNENFIQKLPLSLSGLTNLRKLSAVANKIICIESGIFCNMKNLKELYLDENLLREFPDDLCDLHNLEILECSENELCTLPDRFGSLHELHTLNIDSNNLSALPESFSLLRNVKLFLLSNNSIKDLPDSFPSASKLERLILDKNDISSVPNWFGDLENIEELSIDDNELCNEAFTNDFCKSAYKISRLSGGRNYLTKLPENIGNLKSLTSLHLGNTMLELERSNFQSGNWLSSLPDSFTELVNLKKLHLDENQIQLLPDDFGNLNKLEWLDLGQNQLEFLPDSFCELRALSYLQLSRNKLKALPDSIGNLEKLVELRIDSNMLTKIPESMSNMKLLHSLDLFHNCLTKLPKVLVSLESLKRVDVEQNKFSTRNLPKLVKENVYPERDKSLQNNWRGKTRVDKVKSDVIKMSAIDGECETENSDEEEVSYNENAFRDAMRAGMALWRHHNGAAEREVPSTCMNQVPFTIQNVSFPNSNPERIRSEGSLTHNHFLSHELDEDWDNELRSEVYEDTLEICNKGDDPSSILTNGFQNNTTRYAPCFHAYSPTACYDSLVYRKSEVLPNIGKRILDGEEGQFDDADY